MFLVLVSLLLAHYDSSLVLHGLGWFLCLGFVWLWYLWLKRVLSSCVLADYTWFGSGFCRFWFIWCVVVWVHSDFLGSSWFYLVLTSLVLHCLSWFLFLWIHMVSAGSDLLVLAGNICWFCCSCKNCSRWFWAHSDFLAFNWFWLVLSSLVLARLCCFWILRFQRVTWFWILLF